MILREVLVHGNVKAIQFLDPLFIHKILMRALMAQKTVFSCRSQFSDEEKTVLCRNLFVALEGGHMAADFC
jgi:hypothetical protein